MAYMSNIRNKIIHLLAKHDHLRAKKIYHLLGLDVSYQAVFKMIKQMVTEEILDKNGLDYFLNPNYINEMIQFVDELNLNEKDQYFSIYNKVMEGEVVEEIFQKRVDMFEFISSFLNYMSVKKPHKYTLIHANNIFCLLNSTQKTHDNVKSLVDNSNVYVVIKQNSEWADAVSKIWKRLRLNIKTGINFGGKDTYVYDNIVMRVVTEGDGVDELKELARNTQKMSGLNVTELLYNVFEKNVRIKLEIAKDTRAANQLREKMLHEF